jgi:hypothetical protein
MRSPGATPRAQQPRPARGVFRHLAEREIADIAVLVAETDCELAGILRIDHVPGEVESRGGHRARTAIVVVLVATSFSSA